MPLSRSGTSGSKLVFVHKDSPSAVSQLARLKREYADRAGDRPFVAIVVEGANEAEAEALGTELELDISVFPDLNGTLPSLLLMWLVQLGGNRFAL